MVVVPVSPGVYRIVRVATGDCYVGSTNNLRRRRNEHVRWLKAGKHHSAHLQHAWNLYGETAFLFEVLEQCSADVRSQREQHHLDTLKSTYNILREAGVMPKGGGSEASREAVRRHATGNTYRVGKPHTPGTKALLRTLASGKTASPETRKKMSDAHMGHSVSERTVNALVQRNQARAWTPEERERHAQKASARMTPDARDHLSRCNTGKTASTETKRKMSETRTGKTQSAETRAKIGEARRLAWARKKERDGDPNAA